jgi:hypothetical protein
MQEKRKADEAAQREEARLLFQLAEIQGLTLYQSGMDLNLRDC